MDRRELLSTLPSAVFFVILAVLLVVGWMAGESGSVAAKPTTASVRCEDGHRCNETSFEVNLPDWDLIGFRYDVMSWASEDGRRGCHIIVDLTHPQMFYGSSVLSYTADLANGAKAGVGVQYARIELECRDGHISHRDVTEKS